MKRIILVMAVAVLGAAGYASVGYASAGEVSRDHLPRMRAAADSADSLWRQGRRAISDEDWERAAQLFQRIRDQYPKSSYVADSYYWQAFALYQQGGNGALRRAVTLLDTQRDRFASAETVKNGDSKSLGTRIRGQLARGGDAESAAEIARSARDLARGDASVARGARGMGRSAGSTEPGGCKNEEDDDRVEALNALLQMDAEQAMPILKKVLAKREPCSEILRRKAVFLVSQKRSDEAADLLVDVAKNDPDGETREQAVFWLSQVHSEKAVGLLEQILKTSKDEAIQDKALFSLSQVRDARGAQILRDFATREDAPRALREQAIFWLGQNRSDESAQFLRQLFAKTTDGEVQDKILFSLSQTRGNESWLLDQAVNGKLSVERRKQALFWAAQSNAVDVAKLGALYDKGGDVEFREQVIFTLSQKRDPAAVTKLIEIAKTEKDRDLRKKAIFWLGQSRDPRAAKALLEVIEK
jgi:HEAT repeat protein